MKLFVVVMFIMVPSVTHAQWQVMKEPHFRLVQEPAGTDVAKPQSGAGDKQRNPDEVSSTNKTKPQAVSGQGGSNQAGQNEQYQRWWNAIRRRLGNPDWWMVGLVFIQAIIIYLQLKIGVKTAEAAQQSAEVARDTLQIVERPSLSPEKWEFDIGRNVNRIPDGLVCTLRNTGRTPATVVGGAVDFTMDETTPPRSTVADPDITQKGVFTVYPQGILDYVLSFPAAQYEQRRLAGGNRDRMHLYGHINYTDEFQNCHCLRFCVVEHGRLIPVKEGDYNYTETTKKQEEKQPTWYERIFRK